LIYLIWTPFDFLIHILWIPGQIAFLISIISVIIKLIKLIRLDKTQKELRNQLKIRFIRPMLTILIFLFAVLCLRASRNSADNYAIATSRKIQEICNAKKLCPENIVEWQNVPEARGHNSSILYGKYGTKYRIFYSVSEDRQTFNMAIRHNIDEGLYIEGGVGKQLKIELPSNGKKR
jgi:hypothetical protein